MEDKPEYSIQFEEKNGYLHVFISGERDSIEIAYDYWNKIREKVSGLNCSRLLVEEDFPNQISVIDMYDLAKQLAEMFKGNIKIAHVDRNISDLELNKFAETVIGNRGITGRVFNSVADAVKWLVN